MGDHLVSRPRLTSRLTSATVSIVWAGAGCGKSTLGAELRDEIGVATVEARLDAGDHRPDQVAGRIRRALRRAGRSDAVTAMAQELGSPSAAFEALAEWLAGEPSAVHLVIDDAHNADEDSCGLLARLADSLPPQHRVSFLVRGPAPGLAPLSRLKAAIWLDAADLALTRDEVAALARGRSRIELAPDEAEALRQVTGGWVDAVVLAIGRLADAEDREHELRELTEQPSILAHMVSELFESLDQGSRAGIVQMAHLPLLSVELARLASGGRVPDLLGTASRAGVPMTRIKDGWWEIVAGAREFLAGLDPLDPAVAEPAAEAYLRGGELRLALHVLLRAGLPERAAALIADLAPDRLESLGYAELGALIEVLPAEAVAAHPRVLVHFARACEPTTRLHARTEALERARGIASVAASGPVQREVDVELGRDLAFAGRAREAESIVSAALESCSEGELATQARGLAVLGLVAARAGDHEGIARAESQFERSLILCRALGQTAWARQVTMALVERVHFAGGAYERAIARVDELLRELPARSPQRAAVIASRAGILVDCGRFGEAEVTLAEAQRLIDVTGDRGASGYLAWVRARLASQRGDASVTAAALHEFQIQRADWSGRAVGADFFADAADLLDRVGESAAAGDYLERARERAGDSDLGVRVAEAAMLARGGDPAAARTALAGVRAAPGLQRRDAWRMTLLDAFAASRAADPDAPALARQAFDEAAALGFPTLPQIREPRVAEALLPMAADAGSLDAARLAAEIPPLRISLFGELTLTRGERAVPLPGGKPRELVELVASSSGGVLAEHAIEVLWADATPEAGRRALRNALNRLRRISGEVVIRDGDVIRVHGSAEVDLEAFEREARAVLAAEPEAERTRQALAGYGGEVLPSRREPWVEIPRALARSLRMSLLDLLAETVEAEGRLDEALRLIEQAIHVDPLTERRYLIAARILAAQGRHGSASEMLARGAGTIRAAGLSVPASFAKLEEVIGVQSAHLQAP